jgi:post-segregation antitoxin (ccd killing protein)
MADSVPGRVPRVRTNVSIPKSLHERMQGYRYEVNWSRVAAEAFERALAKLERDKARRRA